MSYDILLYPREPDQDWGAVLAADEADTPEEVLADENALAAGVGTFRRIESRLQRFLTGETETWVAEETGGDVLGEFTDVATGLQVSLFHGAASVTFPYRDVDNLSGFHIKVREAARIVAEETGYEAYDPQTGATFDGTVHDGAGREAARLAGYPDAAADPDDEQDAAADGDGAAPDLAPPTSAPVVHPDPSAGPSGQPGPEPGPAAPLSAREQRIQAMMEARRDPRRVRRRAFFDLALAAGVGVWVYLRRADGETGFLTTVLMILGFMNLLSGVLGLRAASRLAQEQAEGGASQEGPAT